MKTRIEVALTEGQSLDAPKLNDALRAAGLTFNGFHHAQAAIVECAPADEQQVRSIIATHLATDWKAVEAREAVREAAIDSAIAGDATIAQLKGMTNAEFDAWWAANVTTAAQAIAVLKRLARVIIRRVL